MDIVYIVAAAALWAAVAGLALACQRLQAGKGSSS
jgi:hypothetical protein